jgi:hypothetical protein
MSTNTKKYAIKIDNLNLFFAGGGWKHSVDDATRFDTPDAAKAKAVAILESIEQGKPKPPLSIVTLNVRPPVENW